ncbi:thiamine-phosphate synthase [Methanobrevibacter cuticularis]|uniref:Thiamine-phosphate synthase n=1 Tax=Methanobrevibacter cuticularis TaxID=47311 RepID=A0A166D4T6_9EURY|nr:thiamine phosphate synthase [Methanobrevibacter cuticularis]KZX15209.1 thiamine-phosphate synthase [Methanobrevibacter cuticularis]
MKNKIDYSLYLVTNRDNKTDAEFLKIIEKAIIGGVTVVQLREKTISTGEFYNLAKKTKKLTDMYDIPFIINDRLDIALATDADGIHIGQSDMPAKKVRELIGNDKILGVSASTVETAKKAENNGANYIGVGAIFPTETKKTDCITIDDLKEIRNSVKIPVLAIGGLCENNINSLPKDDINGICVVSAIMNSNDPQKASEKLKKAFNKL